MKTKLALAAGLAIVLLGARAASAQSYESGSSAAASYAQGAQSAPAMQSALSYGSYNYGGGFYESSVMEGAGALLAAAGQYNLNSAQAADVLENARAKAIYNYRSAIDARYAIKRANDEYRAAKLAQERMTPELLSRVIQAKMPDRLTAAEYSPRTGALKWPAILEEPEFDVDRAAVEAAFAQRRPEDVGMTSIFYREVSQRTQRMHAKMLAQIDNLSTTDSVAARRFLRSLEFEARHLPEEIGLAMSGR